MISLDVFLDYIKKNKLHYTTNLLSKYVSIENIEFLLMFIEYFEINVCRDFFVVFAKFIYENHARDEKITNIMRYKKFQISCICYMKISDYGYGYGHWLFEQLLSWTNCFRVESFERICDSDELLNFVSDYLIVRVIDIEIVKKILRIEKIRKSVNQRTDFSIYHRECGEYKQFFVRINANKKIIWEIMNKIEQEKTE